MYKRRADVTFVPAPKGKTIPFGELRHGRFYHGKVRGFEQSGNVFTMCGNMLVCVDVAGCWFQVGSKSESEFLDDATEVIITITATEITG